MDNLKKLIQSSK